MAVDEISMVSERTMSLLDDVCKHIRGNEAPMGGLQTIFVGDFKVREIARQISLFSKESNDPYKITHFDFFTIDWPLENPNFSV